MTWIMVKYAVLAALAVLVLVMGGAAVIAYSQGGLGEHPLGRGRREQRRQGIQLVRMIAAILGSVFTLALGAQWFLASGMSARAERIEQDAAAARRGWGR